jgi:hypothetical protein
LGSTSPAVSRSRRGSRGETSSFSFFSVVGLGLRDPLQIVLCVHLTPTNFTKRRRKISKFNVAWRKKKKKEEEERTMCHAKVRH